MKEPTSNPNPHQDQGAAHVPAERPHTETKECVGGASNQPAPIGARIQYPPYSDAESAMLTLLGPYLEGLQAHELHHVFDVPPGIILLWVAPWQRYPEVDGPDIELPERHICRPFYLAFAESENGYGSPAGQAHLAKALREARALAFSDEWQVTDAIPGESTLNATFCLSSKAPKDSKQTEPITNRYHNTQD